MDETGDFSDRTGSAALAGLLVEGEGPALRAALQSAVTEAWPGLAYPPHATELRGAAGVLRGLMRGDGSSRHSLVEEARARVPADALGRLAQARSANLHPALRAVEAHLTRHPSLRARLDACGRAGTSRMRAALRALSGKAFLVAAITGPTEEPSATADKRYDAALTSLFERVLLELRGGPRAVVRVHVAHLRRRDAVPAPKGRPIMPADVARSARHAEAHPFHAEPTDPLRKRVRLVAALPRPYDATVHPGVVLADFVANHMLVPLRRASSMDRLRREAARRTELEVLRVADGLPGAGALPLPTGPSRDDAWGPAWLGEQARAWAAALEAGGDA